MKITSKLALFTRLLAATLTLGPVASTVYAQSPSTVARIDVPFAFETATGQHFRPGVYTLRLEGGSLISLRGTSQSGLMLIRTEGLRNRATKSVANFHRYDHRYFLSDITDAANDRRIHFGECKTEKRLRIAGIAPVAPDSQQVALLQMNH